MTYLYHFGFCFDQFVVLYIYFSHLFEFLDPFFSQKLDRETVIHEVKKFFFIELGIVEQSRTEKTEQIK